MSQSDTPGPHLLTPDSPGQISNAQSTGEEHDSGWLPRSPEHTVLHRVIREQLEPFLARSRFRARPAPHFVEQELRAFLRCGVLAHGFLRLRCDECGHDRLVAFSCKRRGFCPSCGGRRMADTAAHLVDRVLPVVPVRQWVLTLPYPLCYRCAYDRVLTSEVLRAFVRSLFAELRRRVRRHWGGRLPGASSSVWVFPRGRLRSPPQRRATRHFGRRSPMRAGTTTRRRPPTTRDRSDGVGPPRAPDLDDRPERETCAPEARGSPSRASPWLASNSPKAAQLEITRQRGHLT